MSDEKSKSDFRPDIDEYFIDMVKVVASRGSCARRKVGCVLVNDKGHVIGTGYNGKHTGAEECYNNPCSGADSKSGENLDKCEAIHGEANALLQCKDVYDIHTAYVTASPCIHCTKLLLNTSCIRIVYIEEYPAPSKALWLNAGRIWEQSKYV